MQHLTEADVQPAPPPTDDALAHIASLAERLQAEERGAARLTAELKQALDSLARTRDIELPEAMAAVGMLKFELLDGTGVKIEHRLDGAKLTSDEGLQWVEDNGGDSLVKTVITVEFDRGHLDDARGFLQELRDHRLANSFKDLKLERFVHNATIGAFARELTDRGEAPPLDLLGVHHRTLAIVGKRPTTVELKGIKLKG